MYDPSPGLRGYRGDRGVEGLPGLDGYRGEPGNQGIPGPTVTGPPGRDGREVMSIKLYYFLFG